MTYEIAENLAAIPGTARTQHGAHVGWMAKVASEFLSRGDSAHAIEKQSSAPASPCQIGITSVVNEFGAASANTSINGRAVAQVDHIVVVWGLEEECLIWSEPPAGILDDLPPARDILTGKYSVPMD